MKHQILSLFVFSTTLQLVPSGVVAQNAYWGLSTMEFTRNNPTRLEGEPLRKSVAIHLNAAKMTALKGARIVGIRMAYATNKVDGFKIFVTKDLNGPCLQETSPAVNSRPYTLADYLFDVPIDIDGTDLYVGYEVTAQDASRPVYFFDKSADYAAGTVWAWLNERWTDVSSMGLGAPVFQLILEGMPDIYTDVAMKSSTTDSYFKICNEYSSENKLFNLGTAPITSLKVRTQFEGMEARDEVVTGLNIQPGTEGVFTSHHLKSEDSGTKTWSVSVLSVNDADDADPSDNTYASDIYVYPDGVSRNILIEKYTGQDCKWCPAGDAQIAKFMEDRDDLIEVVHHTYVGGDAFAMAESMTYMSTFGITLHPSVTLNRFPVSTSSVVVNDISTSLAGVTAVTNNIVRQPIPVVVGLQNQFDETTRKGQLTVKINTYENLSHHPHALNLWLTQDHLIANQSGASSNYDHSNVFRGTLNGETWGEPITLTAGEDLVKTYDYEIPSAIASTAGTRGVWNAVPSDMHIVAFVADRTDSPLTNIIYNVNSIGVTTNGSTAGMTAVSISKPQVVVADRAVSVFGRYDKALVFAMDGKQVAKLNGAGRVALSKGVYVVCVDGQSSKVVVK